MLTDNKHIVNEQEIKDRANTLEVIGQFVKLKRNGATHIALCPFHNEKSPSFTVHAVKGFFKCHGCGAGGDTITFLMKHENITYPDALKWLAAFYNIAIEGAEASTYIPKPPTARKVYVRHEPSYIPKEAFNSSLDRYDQNNFVKFLHTLFEPDIVAGVIERYHIGTSEYYLGGVIFWQIDECGNVRTGKIMPYNPITGKRDRQTTPASNWAHTVMELNPFNLSQCLFGQHLLSDGDNKPIAVFESEKTCIVASVFLPEFICVATGGKKFDKFTVKGERNEITETTRELLQPLASKRTVFFPDLGALEDWREMILQLGDPHFDVSDLLHNSSKDLNIPDKGDLCDFLTSDAAGRELIDSYKEAINVEVPKTTQDNKAIFERFKNVGLRFTDHVTAVKELCADI